MIAALRSRFRDWLLNFQAGAVRHAAREYMKLGAFIAKRAHLLSDAELGDLHREARLMKSDVWADFVERKK